MSKKSNTVDLCEVFEKVYEQAEKGDIIISSTQQLSYATLRKVLNARFDHLSVFLDTETVIHISWPRVREIPALKLFSNLSEYVILRPKFESEEQKTIFLNILKQSLNAKYDLPSLLKGMSHKMKRNVGMANTQIHENVPLNITKNQLCTDLIFYALSVSSAQFRALLQDKMHLLEYSYVGSFSADDLFTLAENSTFFTKINERLGGSNKLPQLPQLSTVNLIQPQQTAIQLAKQLPFHASLVLGLLVQLPFPKL